VCARTPEAHCGRRFPRDGLGELPKTLSQAARRASAAGAMRSIQSANAIP
jgi:hypothetical protein